MVYSGKAVPRDLRYLPEHKQRVPNDSQPFSIAVQIPPVMGRPLRLHRPRECKALRYAQLY